VPVALRGQRELLASLKYADRETRLGVRRELRKVAAPVAADAEALALSAIRNMARSPKWARMRVGVTRQLVYVAPRQKGVRGRGGGRRPNLADLLMDRAMLPALHRHEAEIEQRLEHMLDVIADGFNRGGGVL
jgi:hypothetical protein